MNLPKDKLIVLAKTIGFDVIDDESGPIYCTPDGLLTFANAIAEKERDEQQAEIDRLMLEFCPDEMTPEQKENWAKHQVTCSLEMEAEIDAAIRAKKE